MVRGGRALKPGNARLIPLANSAEAHTLSGGPLFGLGPWDVGETWRHRIAVALTVVGGVLVVLSIISSHLARTVFSRAGFAEAGTEVLTSPAGREVLTSELIRALEKSNPDLVAVRPVVRSAAEGALSSDVFKAVAKEALGAMSDAMFRPDDGGVVIDVANLALLARQGLLASRPELARTVSLPSKKSLVRLTTGSMWTRAATVASRNRSRRLWFALGCGLAFLGAIAIEPRRRRGVGGVGGAVAVAAGVVIAGLIVGRAAIGAGWSPVVNQSVSAAVWTSFTRDLWLSAFVVAVLGLLLAAASIATGERLKPEKVYGAIESTLTRHRHGTFGVVQGICFIAVGLVMFAEPEVMVHLGTLVMGAWAVLFGTTRILAVTAPSEAMAKPPIIRRSVAEFGAVVLGFGGVIGALTYFALRSKTEPFIAPPSDEQACNGHRELCDRRLDQVAFAATHNSNSNADDGYLNPDQLIDITAQLNAGYRALLIDTYYGRETTKGNIRTEMSPEAKDRIVSEIGEEGYNAAVALADRRGVGAATGEIDMFLCHAACAIGAQRFVDELTNIRKWLEDNPREVLILFIEDEVSVADAEGAFETAGLLPMTWRMERGATLPTLAKMIRADRRVLVLGEDHGGDPSTWYHRGFPDLVQETPYANATQESLHREESCERNRGNADSPLLLVNSWVATYPPLASDAIAVNTYEFLHRRVKMCQRARGQLPNLIAINFGSIGAVLGVVDELNRVGDD